MSTNRGYMLASSIGFLSLLAILGDWFCLNKHHSCNSLSPLPIRWRTLEEVQKNPPLAWFRSESYVYIHIEKENIRLRHTLLGGRIVCLYTHRERKYTPTPHTARWEGLWRRFHIVGALGDTFITLYTLSINETLSQMCSGGDFTL